MHQNKNKMNDLVNFTVALLALEEGKRIAREDFDEGCFLFKRKDTEVPLDVVPKMNSLPETVQRELVEVGYPLSFYSQINIVNIKPEDETTYISDYTPNAADLFGDQWRVLD